jgi:hypothetical protein
VARRPDDSLVFHAPGTLQIEFHPAGLRQTTQHIMKALLLLAIVALAAPATSLAGRYGHFRGGYGPYYYPPYAYFPPPVVGLAYGVAPYGEDDGRYDDRDAASLEASVQRALRREGYYSGPVDGDLGPRSRAAIREYQTDHRMAATGRIDSRLLRSLGI